MALLSKKEFAGLCGMETKKLSVSIGRDKVVVDDDGLIDSENDINKAFLFKMQAKKGITSASENIPIPEKPAKKPKTIPDITDESGDDVDITELDSLPVAERRLKHFSARKTEKEVLLLDMRKEKLEGLVVPTEMVKTLIMHHSRSITMAFKSVLDNIITIYSAKYKLDAKECAAMRQKGLELINSGIESAIAESKDGLENIVTEYSLSRGVGERG